MLVLVFLLLCIGAVLLAVYGRCRFVKYKAKNSSSKEVNTEAEERLVSPRSIPSKGVAHFKIRFSEIAVVRSDLNLVLSPERNDDVPPMVTAVFGRCEERYVHISHHHAFV